jgi:hypothetical protein
MRSTPSWERVQDFGVLSLVSQPYGGLITVVETRYSGLTGPPPLAWQDVCNSNSLLLVSKDKFIIGHERREVASKDKEKQCMGLIQNEPDPDATTMR